jgi:hypothetical protein
MTRAQSLLEPLSNYSQLGMLLISMQRGHPLRLRRTRTREFFQLRTSQWSIVRCALARTINPLAMMAHLPY